MNKSLSDLISWHCDLFDNSTFTMIGATRFQVDYLRFYVPEDKALLYWTPFSSIGAVRDNPNYQPTEYENVYMMTDYKSSLRDYIIPWFAPVSVLRWSYVKVKNEWEYKDMLEVCIYWKALALYYAWHLNRLDDFVIRYGWQCSRVDLCRDFKQKLPWDKFQLENYTDLKRSAEYLNTDATDYDTVYYWKKHSQ